METPLEFFRIGSYARRSNYIRWFRTPRCLFLPNSLSSGMQITLSMEAHEKKLAHRDLLIAWRWNWIKCTFLDTIRYLEITECLSPWQSMCFSVRRTRLMVACSATVMSWVNTPMSSLLVGPGRGLSESGAQVVIWGLVSLEKGFWALECTRSNCIRPLWTESANSHFVIQNYKPT